jgi:hypothetical protein
MLYHKWMVSVVERVAGSHCAGDSKVESQCCTFYHHIFLASLEAGPIGLTGGVGRAGPTCQVVGLT